MNIIVTGGAGFIGSNFIFHMLGTHPEDRIICLDALTYAGNLSTLSGILEHPQFRFVKGDITDREAVILFAKFYSHSTNALQTLFFGIIKTSSHARFSLSILFFCFSII